MDKFDKKDFGIQFFIFLLSLICVSFLFHTHGNLMVDIGREFYISERVAEGGVLYKEIFNIYGPLAYQINGLLFKIFGIHMNVLNVFGSIVGILIIQCIYVLSRQFLDRFYSGLLGISCSILLLLKLNIFNYVVPYSFGMSYGLLFVFLSLILLIRFAREDNLEKALYLSAMFAGAAFVSKYDYALYSLVFPFCFLFVKRISWKTFACFVASFFIVPFISFLHLVLGGLNYDDIVWNISLFKRITTAPGLVYFYKTVNVFPSVESLSLIKLFSFFCLCFIPYFVCAKCSKKIVYELVGVFLAFFFLLKVEAYFTYYVSALWLLGIFVANKKINDKSLWLLLVCSALLSFKTFFTSFFSYAVYPFPFVLISFVVVYKRYMVKNELAFKYIFSLLVVLYTLVVSWLSIEELEKYQGNLVTARGKYTVGSINSPESKLIELIQSITAPNDKVVILPEGHIVNFLTDRKSDDMYNNFIPMYVEAFGEQNIINHYAQHKPDYFVLSSSGMGGYGKNYICGDYANSLCDWILDNYNIQYRITGTPTYVVLKERK